MRPGTSGSRTYQVHSSPEVMVRPPPMARPRMGTKWWRALGVDLRWILAMVGWLAGVGRVEEWRGLSRHFAEEARVEGLMGPSERFPGAVRVEGWKIGLVIR